jgi:DNA-binding transcriptional regulator PaaX
MTRQNKEIAKTILKIMGITGLIAGVIVFPGLIAVIEWFEKETRYDKKQIRNAFYGLKKRDFISYKNSSRGNRLVLTPKGKERLTQISLSELTIKRPSKWDGKWRLVMFDIPERIKSSRDLIRQHLHRLSFVQIQKSVFINPYPSHEAIVLLRKNYDLPDGTLYIFESRVLEGEDELKKIFKL